MSYTIPDSCYSCGTCQPQCPTGAIHAEEGQYWIEPGLCNNCEGHAPAPICVIGCPISSPMPLRAKKGRYKSIEHLATSPDLFANGKNNPFASSMVVWEACNLLTSAPVLPWKTDKRGALVYERQVKQGRGLITFSLTQDIESHSPQPLNQQQGQKVVEGIDMRAASMHLIFAAYATLLDQPWQEEFIINDQQIEKYLGLDKRKDLTKPNKLTLIKTLVQQSGQILAAIEWPQQGKVNSFSIPESRIWHIKEIKHHFQKDDLGCQHLTGLAFKIQAGIWSKYFLNKHSYRRRTAFYQYGSLPQFLLTTTMSIWQQHQGALRMMLWLLFKTKMGSKQCITVPTLLRVAYGEEKIMLANGQREQRKRLIKAFESDLEVLNHYGLKPVFDPVTYPLEIQPLWAKLANIPDDADAALDFWIEDGSSENSLTSSSPRGKWKLLQRARIVQFDLPTDWEQQIAKLEKKKQQRISRKQQTRKQFTLSSEQILSARQRQGISQRQLAQMAGKSQSWVRDLEQGRFLAKPEDQALLKKVLGLN
jgi:DNA-binding transcriptional regulator YiaG